MQALTLIDAKKTALRDLPEREPRSHEVKIRVHRVGLCGSDLNAYRGLLGLVSFPRVPGHEVSGEVVAVGREVDTCRVGDKVAVLPYTECGRCAACRTGRANACENNQTLGVQRDGALAATLIVAGDKVLVRNAMSYDQLALVEPLAVGMHAARRTGVDVGEHVVVFGCGVIGLGAIAAAASKGGRVTAVDIDDRKRDVALACGADAFFNSRSGSVTDMAKTLDDGRGPAVVIEAVGSDIAFRQAVDIVAFAGRVAYVGYGKKEVAYDTSLFVKKELDIRGSRNAMLQDFIGVLSLFEHGKYPEDQLISAHYPLERAGEALAHWDSDPGSVIKILVDV